MRPIEPYIRFWETISPAALDHLDRTFAPDIRFRDPFNDISGTAALRAVLEPMFRHLEDPRFAVSRAADAGDNVWLLRWDFTCRFRRRDWRLPGMSEVVLSQDGRAAVHIDHWDSGTYFYGQLPLLGGIIGFIRRRVGRH
jgi:limonene-1,2-epoxide hydrolase